MSITLITMQVNRKRTEDKELTLFQGDRLFDMSVGEATTSVQSAVETLIEEAEENNPITSVTAVFVFGV